MIQPHHFISTTKVGFPTKTAMELMVDMAEKTDAVIATVSSFNPPATFLSISVTPYLVGYQYKPIRLKDGLQERALQKYNGFELILLYSFYHQLAPLFALTLLNKVLNKKRRDFVSNMKATLYQWLCF